MDTKEGRGEQPNDQKDERVYPGSSVTDAQEQCGSADSGLLGQRKGILLLAAISLVLILVSVGYFASRSNMTGALGLSEGVLQTTDQKDGGGDKTLEDDDAAENPASDVSQGDPEKSDASVAADDGASGGIAGSGASADSGASAPAGGSSGSSAAAPQSGGSSAGQQAPAPSTMSIRVIVDSSAVGGGVYADTTLAFEPGATAYDALCGCGLSVNARESGFGVYVAAIGGLAEKEHGAESGWKYSVNGSFPGFASSGYELKDGDVVKWVYVTSA